MSDPQPTPRSEPGKRPNMGSRFLFVFLLGLVVGGVGVAYLMRMWLGGPDTYPRATMQVIGAQMGGLHQSVQRNRCNATDTLPHLQAMRTLGSHLDDAFEELRDDERFVTHSSRFRANLDDALASPPLDCAGVVAVQDDIEQTCDACHQDFR